MLSKVSQASLQWYMCLHNKGLPLGSLPFLPDFQNHKKESHILWIAFFFFFLNISIALLGTICIIQIRKC